ncbi:hypothetical protein AB4Z45_21740 [Paenibacillus sp. MCAF9]|uniref:hypothetical protein n=1 Tax=Paenibacillus sp. MCAF9 TaxID=3233046 RepID=UPI003F9B1DA9
MSWKIRVYELRKALLSPVIIALLLVFTAYNLFLIAQEAYKKDEMSILNELVAQFGSEITKPMQEDYKSYYLSRLDEMNKLTNKRTSQTYEMPSDFFEYENYKRYVTDQPNLYSSDELDLFNELRVIQNYYFLMQDIDDTYAGFDMKQIAEGEIKKYGFSGSAADLVRQRYDYIAERLHQLIASGEHKNLFFIGQIYQSHAMLFKTLIGSILLQLMILVVLMTGYIGNYEFEQGTHLLHYSTKRGRKLQTDKLLSSFAASIIVTTALTGFSLSAYFLTFSYKGLWKVPVSSFFNWEFGMPYPYLTWHTMSYIAYLGCAIALIFVLLLIFTAITFVLTAIIRNSYLVFGAFAILFGSFLLITNLVPRDLKLILFTGFTPFHLVLNSKAWFTASGAFMSLPNNEWITAGIWLALLALCCILCLHQFKRQNIN